MDDLSFDDGKLPEDGAAQTEFPDGETPFFGKRGEPSYERIAAMALKLKAFAESPETEAAARAGRRAVTLHIHSFLHECRSERGLMGDLKDVIGILALRRGLTWAKSTPHVKQRGQGPYRLLVEIIYPALPVSAIYAIANALAIVYDRDPAGAQRHIRKSRGIDKMHRRTETTSARTGTLPVRRPTPRSER